jgi:hypothetical protein
LSAISPRDDQQHEAEHHDQRGQQVGHDQRTPGQRAQYVTQPDRASAVLGTDQAAQEPGQEHRAEQADARRPQRAEQRSGQPGVAEQMIDADLHRRDHEADHDRDRQDPPGVPPPGTQHRRRDGPGRQGRLTSLPPRLTCRHGT